MKDSPFASGEFVRYELRFESLLGTGCGMAFPCDSAGKVDLDTLSDRRRNNYLYARAVIGIEFATPAVQVCRDEER